MAKHFNRRAFITLTLFFCFCVMLVTSILMFAWRHSESVSMLHTLLGFALLFVVFWHLKNNLSSFISYLKLKSAKATKKINIALPVAIVLSVGLVTLSLLQFMPFRAIYNWGNTLRAGDEQKEDVHFTYERIEQIHKGATGNKLTIDLRKGAYFLWPQYAIWLETMEGEFIQPLFITQKLANNKFSNKAIKKDRNKILTSNPFTSNDEDLLSYFAFESDPDGESLRVRPESLPIFLHKVASKKSSEVFVPTENNEKFDAYAGATLLDNFLLTTQASKLLPEKYRVRFEINQSFDFNQYYSSNRFPDDAIYSGDGFVGQPSVIYEAIIDLSTQQKYFPMRLIGRGHHSGMDGQIYLDMDNLTTATQLIDRIIVELP